jgi:hypothetical protein
MGLISPPLARYWLPRWTNSSKPVPCPASVVQAQTHDTGHRLLNMVQNGLEQPDRSTEGTHQDSRGAAMTAGLQLSGGGPC